MIFKENRAIYLQIADRLCEDIVSGIYPEEGRIPSVREFAACVEVNANTVVRSYDYLQQNEIIYNKRGLGYFVTSGAQKRITRMKKAAFMNEDLPELFRKMRTLQIPIEEIITLYKKENDTLD